MAPRYNPATNTWAKMPTSGLQNRFGHTAVWTGSEMIVWGGTKDSIYTFYNDGARYNPTTNTWTDLPESNLSARYKHIAVWTGTEMIIWGGTGGGNGMYGDGGRYNPSLNSWTILPSTPSYFFGRYNHTAIWTGSKMILWGGQDFNNRAYSDGIQYNPSNNTWGQLASPGLQGRIGSAAVWTGSEMIIWGGYGDSYYPDGARYDLSSKTWKMLPPVPDNFLFRTGYSVIWTGSKMILWGGNNGGDGLKDGVMYDPSTDTWTMMADAPADMVERFLHTAIWTGEEMVVWGGQAYENGSTVYYNDGARYNPATDTWTMLASVPSNIQGRFAHSAVWSGSGMLIWGGKRQYGTNFMDGAQYTPSTDTWEILPMNNLSSRSGYTTVWTGQEMIVWGGTMWGGTSGYCYNDGARYDPAIKVWEMLTAFPNGMSGRDGHVMVWTGSEVIVWGGACSYTTTTFYNDGARGKDYLANFIPIVQRRQELKGSYLL